MTKICQYYELMKFSQGVLRISKWRRVDSCEPRVRLEIVWAQASSRAWSGRVYVLFKLLAPKEARSQARTHRTCEIMHCCCCAHLRGVRRMILFNAQSDQAQPDVRPCGRIEWMRQQWVAAQPAALERAHQRTNPACVSAGAGVFT